jgi:hypothetical protein
VLTLAQIWDDTHGQKMISSLSGLPEYGTVFGSEDTSLLGRVLFDIVKRVIWNQLSLLPTTLYDTSRIGLAQ